MGNPKIKDFIYLTTYYENVFNCYHVKQSWWDINRRVMHDLLIQKLKDNLRWYWCWRRMTTTRNPNPKNWILNHQNWCWLPACLGWRRTCSVMCCKWEEARKPDPFYNLANYMLNEVINCEEIWSKKKKNCEEIGYNTEWERKNWIFGLKRLNSLFFLH